MLGFWSSGGHCPVSDSEVLNGCPFPIIYLVNQDLLSHNLSGVLSPIWHLPIPGPSAPPWAGLVSRLWGPACAFWVCRKICPWNRDRTGRSCPDRACHATQNPEDHPCGAQRGQAMAARRVPQEGCSVSSPGWLFLIQQVTPVWELGAYPRLGGKLVY